MTTLLETLRYESGMIGEEAADRIEELERQLSEREKQIVMLREALATAIEFYVPTTQAKQFLDVLDATKDLSGLRVCYAEPVWVAETTEEKQLLNGKPRRLFWECNEGVGTPLYKARKP
jgi:hypothetical protein